jgi:cation:H+ antiporter
MTVGSGRVTAARLARFGPLLVDVLVLLAGLALLAKAADVFVAGAGRVALGLRVAPIIVGVLVVGFGTSAPELLISGLAAAEGALPIAVGNVVGSNIANVTLVAGGAALFLPLAVTSMTLRREAPIAAGSVVLFAVLVQGGLTRVEGAVLLGALVFAAGLLLHLAVREDDPIASEVQARCAPEDVAVGREARRTALGLLGVIAGAQLIVMSAQGIADSAGLDEGFVGLTIVAIGTSLPEMVTAIQAVRQNQTDLLVGNLFGSNMFNALGVGGTVALVGPGPLDDGGLTTVAVGAMVVAALLAWALFGTGRRLVRWEAVVLLVVYAAALAFV